MKQGIMASLPYLLFILSLVASEEFTLNIGGNKKIILQTAEDGAFNMLLQEGDQTRMLSKNYINTTQSFTTTVTDEAITVQWGGESRMEIKLQKNSRSDLQSRSIFTNGWIVNKDIERRSCHNLSVADQWYGGASLIKNQQWPIQDHPVELTSYLPHSGKMSLAERYWIHSKGVFVFINKGAPLFIAQNSKVPNELCFVTKGVLPYSPVPGLYTFLETWVSSDDMKEGHQFAISSVLTKPESIPDKRMLQYPIWSTKAKYGDNINEENLIKFANEITTNDMGHSLLQIDGKWESCYGSLKFDEFKFPSPLTTINALKNRGFKIALMVHPFINKECGEIFLEASNAGYLVKGSSGSVDTTWWNSEENGAAHIDFTNPAAKTWFVKRLTTLKTIYGIDTFKFEGGETNYLPRDPLLTGEDSLIPTLITQEYVKTAAEFGPDVEVRTGTETQNLTTFIRMSEKQSTWSKEDGLPTLVTSLLQMNMVGYMFVIPEVIGGIGFNNQPPSKELFIRWLQAAVFMPAIKFSYLPWDFDEETVTISKKFVKLHAEYGQIIADECSRSIEKDEPLNPPVWWVDVNDKTAHIIDDQFMLGNKIMAAPILIEGQTSRDIYLPKGSWEDGNTGEEIEGPKQISNYKAPLDTLPYFIYKSDAMQITVSVLLILTTALQSLLFNI